MARSFARTLQAHRLDAARLWVVLLAGACAMGLAWTWWAYTEHGDAVTAKAPAKAPAKRAGAGR